ncbi:hypothetical protein BDZ97DRAFT_957982 [Flammula alnicola]|nr:hypothetical protein BDZ97DRAFT_957982 [Flammula alnicola]
MPYLSRPESMWHCVSSINRPAHFLAAIYTAWVTFLSLSSSDCLNKMSGNFDFDNYGETSFSLASYNDPALESRDRLGNSLWNFFASTWMRKHIKASVICLSFPSCPSKKTGHDAIRSSKSRRPLRGAPRFQLQRILGPQRTIGFSGYIACSRIGQAKFKNLHLLLA